MYRKESLLKQLRATHTREAIRTRLQKGPQHSYLKDFIYGAIDGTVTTFAVVAGVAGAHLSPGIVIILGLANLLGDGFSMAASNYLGTTAERQQKELARAEEEKHISLIPEGEREEIRQIFEAKGFKGEDLERIVTVVTSDVKMWTDTMLKEELGFPPENVSAFRAAFSTFIAFLIIGFLPILSFVLKLFLPNSTFDPFIWSSGITGLTFFLVGALKSRFVGKNWFSSGLETFVVGGAAAALAYFIGYFLAKLVT